MSQDKIAYVVPYMIQNSKTGQIMFGCGFVEAISIQEAIGLAYMKATQDCPAEAGFIAPCIGSPLIPQRDWLESALKAAIPRGE